MDVLETARLMIRPFTIDDLETAHQLLDIELEWSGPAFSIAQREERLRFYIQLAAWGDAGQIYGYRAIILKAAQRLIGICGFTPSLWTARSRASFEPGFFCPPHTRTEDAYTRIELEIGYALAAGDRGQGYASEAAGALIDYAFNQLHIDRIVAATDHQNTASIKLMQRLGMRTARNTAGEWPEVAGIIDNPTL